MSAGYRVSAKAIEDLEDIWLYTLETWSQKQADRYYDLLINEFEYIATHFSSGRPVDYIKAGYRAAKVKSHVIFYRKTENEMVEIIRILHQSMDIENRLR